MGFIFPPHLLHERWSSGMLRSTSAWLRFFSAHVPQQKSIRLGLFCLVVLRRFRFGKEADLVFSENYKTAATDGSRFYANFVASAMRHWLRS